MKRKAGKAEKGTVPIWYFSIASKGRTITVIHKMGTVLNIYLNPPGSGKKALLERIRSGYPGTRKRTDPSLKRQLTGYFLGTTKKFRIRCDLSGMTPFHAKVLEETSMIPWGRTLSYGEIALRLGSRGLSRAVGSALAANPVPIVIPCHRVVRTGGATGGFMSCRVDKTGWKRLLLGIESGPASPDRIRGPRPGTL